MSLKWVTVANNLVSFFITKMKSSSWVSSPLVVLKLSQPFRLGVCIYCYFVICVSLNSCQSTADRATFMCFQNNMTRNNWHTMFALGTRRTLNQHLFQTCFIIIPVCCTYVCAVFVTCPSDSMWAFEQDVACWFTWALHPPEGTLCVCMCVWVDRNGRRLETVKISGSRSSDCDDYCRRAVTPCNLLSWVLLFWRHVAVVHEERPVMLGREEKT